MTTFLIVALLVSLSPLVALFLICAALIFADMWCNLFRLFRRAA